MHWGHSLVSCWVRQRCDGMAGPSELVLERRQGENLTPLECLVEAVELQKDEFSVAVVLGACGLRLRVCACSCSSLQ